MSKLQAFQGLTLVVLLARALLAEEPVLSAVDYSSPGRYLEFPETLGDREAISKLALEMKGETERQTIGNVLAWMSRNLKCETEKAYAWRNFDDVVREKAYGGCADYAIVCGVLLKGAGIPAVWVKTMDVAWIWDFKRGRPFGAWSGHVFLEVFLEGAWALLDPGGKRLYQGYSPAQRILPGNRFAYHKGNDPKAMIFSLQWKEWKEQTGAHFRSLDESLLPVDEKGGRPVAPRAWIAGDSPYYETLQRLAEEAGLEVAASFNADYERFLPEAAGGVLIVETHGGKPIIPAEILEKHFPGALKGLSALSKRTAINGTVILFVDFSEPLRGLEWAGKGGEQERGRAEKR